MLDLIQSIKDTFDLIVDFITNMVEGLGVLVNSLSQILNFFNVSWFYSFFPGFLAVVLVLCTACLVVLRIIGR